MVGHIGMRLSRRSRRFHRSRRSRCSFFLPCVLAAVALLPQVSATAIQADRQPGCSAPAGHAFPVATRIHGGPDSYRAGGADQTWFIDLKNTTAHSCGSIHPVVVLVDGKHALTAAQPKLEFFEGDRAHPVAFARTDQQELVGAFDDGFPGFTVGPGQTLTVKVRFALASGTRADDVVANAAIVQRHGNDGDWVGESNEYRFRIEEGSGPADTGTAEREPKSPEPGRSPAGEALANTGPQSSHGIDPTVGGLVLAAVSVLITGTSFLLYRRRR